MQEEVTQKTIALVFKSSRLTADVLKKAMKMYLQRQKAGQQATHGKMSVKKLVGQGMGASSIEVTDNNIKSFERVARKYNVDFAVKKDKTVEPPKYARNKNILVIGGSGSGKTRFFVKPNLMQMHSSYVVTDPKGLIYKVQRNKRCFINRSCEETLICLYLQTFSQEGGGKRGTAK